jgi:hypothetical protein
MVTRRASCLQMAAKNNFTKASSTTIELFTGVKTVRLCHNYPRYHKIGTQIKECNITLIFKNSPVHQATEGMARERLFKVGQFLEIMIILRRVFKMIALETTRLKQRSMLTPMMEM